MENKLLFATENITIFGAELSGKDTYPNITVILDKEYPHQISVPKAAILSVLDRLSIFTNPYDNNGIKLTFTNENLAITDLKGTNIEKVEYNEKVTVTETTLTVNINFLMDLIQAVQDLNVNIHFGDEGTLKIVDNDVTEILGLMNSESDE